MENEKKSIVNEKKNNEKKSIDDEKSSDNKKNVIKPSNSFKKSEQKSSTVPISPVPSPIIPEVMPSAPQESDALLPTYQEAVNSQSYNTYGNIDTRQSYIQPVQPVNPNQSYLYPPNNNNIYAPNPNNSMYYGQVNIPINNPNASTIYPNPQIPMNYNQNNYQNNNNSKKKKKTKLLWCPKCQKIVESRKRVKFNYFIILLMIIIILLFIFFQKLYIGIILCITITVVASKRYRCPICNKKLSKDEVRQVD